MGFTKLDSAIFDSSIMDEERRTKMVWVLLLAAADRHGVVDATHQALARKFNEPIADVRFAIGVLESPDPESRSQAEEGRRIVRLDDHREWGWRIVNHGMYRNTRDDEGRRTYKTKWQANKRALDRGEEPPYPDILQGDQSPRGQSTKSTKVHVDVRGPMQKQMQSADAEAEAEPEAGGADGVPPKPSRFDAAGASDLSFDAALLKAIPGFQEMWRRSMNLRQGLSIGSQQLQIDEFAKFCAEHGAEAAIAVLNDANLGSYKKPVFKAPGDNGRPAGKRRHQAGAREEVEQQGPDEALLAGMVSSLERCKRDGLAEQAHEIQADIDGYRSRHHLTDADKRAG